MAAIDSPKLSEFSRALNKATKWAVTGAVAGVLVWRRDVPVLWAVTGAVLNGANAKLLKKCINQARPTTAMGIKIDPGMPSSHSQSLAYLSTYASLGILEISGLNFPSCFFSLCVLSCALYLAYLRVATGLHTAPQVIVGGLIGSWSAVLWCWLWKSFVEQAVVKAPWVTPLLWALFAFTVVTFVVHVVKKWRFGDA